MTRIKILVAYDGTDFAGWQLQGKQRTVQREVEGAIIKIAGRRLPVVAAGRTDSGVHALGQCAHFDIPDSLAHVPWRIAINGYMPLDVRIVTASVVRPTFHAQFEARSKIYAYTLWHDTACVNPLRRNYVWSVPPLDHGAMDEAAAILMGQHDFNSFRNAGTSLGSRGTVRTLMGLWRDPGPSPVETVWRARADGFLKQMVRNLMGCLVAVGRGKVTPDAVRCILERCDRTHLLPTAPARGLCMERVFYDEDEVGSDAAPAAASVISGEAAHDDHCLAGGDRPLEPEHKEHD